VFTVVQRDGRSEFRPAPLWSSSGTLVSAFGAALLFYLAATLLKVVHSSLPGSVLGFIFLVSAGMVAWQAITYWRQRTTPLLVERNGRVSYGNRECCAAGSVDRVCIAADPAGEHGDCRVVIEQTGGIVVPLPLPYFGTISQREVARVLARELAAALNVECVELT
jgi:hypothetical protein